MKKIINKKSYNTEYDSKLVAVYTSIIDGWCRDKKYYYQKKSTGEYFLFSGKDSWHPGDIRLVSEKEMKEVMSHIKKGEVYRYTAMMEVFPGTRSKGYFWGTKDDDPWDEEKIEKRKEERKKKEEEMKKKREDKKGDFGEIQITGVSKDGMKFKNFGKTVLPAHKYGKVLAWKVNFRYINNNFDVKDGDRWYRDKVYVVLEGGDKDQVKDIFNGVVSGVEKDFGQWDVFMKDGNLEFSKKNEKMYGELHKRMKDYNIAVIEK